VAFFVCSRFRVPVLPVLAVLSGHAVVRVAAWGRARDARALGGAALVVALAVLPTQLRPSDKLVDPRANGYLLLGQAALRDGDLPAAEEHFTAALEYKESGYGRAGLARTFLLQGLVDQAILTAGDGLDRLLAVRRTHGLSQPGEPELVQLFAWAHEARGGPAAAAAALERRLERDPGLCAGYSELARRYEAVGQGAAARRVRQAGAAAGCR